MSCNFHPRTFTEKDRASCGTPGCLCNKGALPGFSFTRRRQPISNFVIPTPPPFIPGAFVTQWQTNSLTIRLPIPPNTFVNALIIWGDGESGTYTTSPSWIEHTYPDHGKYTVTITGQVDKWSMKDLYDDTGTDEFTKKLVDVLQFGKVGLTKLNFAFATNITTFSATDVPETTITDMSYMFFATPLANPDVSKWDTSNVTDMSHMFEEAFSANPDVSTWNTGKVTDMSFMFSSTPIANPNVFNWNTSQVTNMSDMFSITSEANPAVSKWDTFNVTNMGNMFAGASKADPITTNWKTDNVTNMSSMFADAVMANPQVGFWNTEKVTDMGGMFNGAVMANPDVSNWNTGNVTNMGLMFNGAVMANPQVGFWNTEKVTDMGGMFTNATLANPQVSSWNVSMVTNMASMFAGSAFNRDLQLWDFGSINAKMDFFVFDCSLNQANYDSLVVRLVDTLPTPPPSNIPPGPTSGTLWSAPTGDGVLDTNGMAGFAPAAVATLKNSLVFNWTIDAN